MLITLAIIGAEDSAQESVKHIESKNSGIVCSGRYAEIAEAEREIRRSEPMVALVDLEVLATGPASCIRALREASPGTKLLMLTLRNEHEQTFQSLAAGASGYVLKPVEPFGLLKAIKNASRGGEPMSPEIAAHVISAFGPPTAPQKDLAKLTPREYQILSELAAGELYKEIAAKLDVSYRTVHTHIERIYRKLHVHSRAQAAAKFRQG
jgi:DNA-binding NarL/FixJ family response regulator